MKNFEETKTYFKTLHLQFNRFFKMAKFLSPQTELTSTSEKINYGPYSGIALL